ncbi:hypothetical protein B8W69_02865 [Mycobacterium vulneris]|uniref:Uncharacterized protein n=1 Tax=Mycolicibacterium vulneris TaxID=547163 RepID=A0A1X2LDQ9_9MYCO|nr:hypothetical protein [Mycolicibacterium vulneris]OSC32055.1 hypothetical protein B8W69_02865 [Mycolicibacterium vulneris]
MSLAQLESQIDDLRKQAANIQSRWARTTDLLDADNNLSETGKRAKLDSEHAHFSAKLSDLRNKEKELIAAKRQSLEKFLFGLTSVTSDPGQIIAYRDAQDRAARLTHADEAGQVFAAAIRSDDKTLAAAILGRALESGWSSIVAEYIKQNPSAKEQLDDLAKLREYDSFGANLLYAILSPSLGRV